MTTESSKKNMLGDTMKSYETDILIDSEKPWIMRLDGIFLF